MFLIKPFAYLLSITSPEIQIPRETGEGDIYFAWEVKKDKPKKEINIIEKEATSTTTPMLVTSLRHIAFLKKIKFTSPSTTPKYVISSDTQRTQLQTRGAYDDIIFVRKANLLFNYDGGTNPELKVVGMWISDLGAQVGSGKSRLTKLDFQVSSHPSECSLIGTNGDNVYTTFSSIPLWNLKKFFFNAWEYDWGSSSKPLGAVQYAGIPLNFSGSRQFTDEWYVFDPQLTQDVTFALPMTFLFNNTGGTKIYPQSSNNPDGTINNCGNATQIKAELEFTKGWY
jgi:hypothetical protein